LDVIDEARGVGEIFINFLAVFLEQFDSLLEVSTLLACFVTVDQEFEHFLLKLFSLEVSFRCGPVLFLVHWGYVLQIIAVAQIGHFFLVELLFLFLWLISIAENHIFLEFLVDLATHVLDLFFLKNLGP
jgi:hypothetical protein